MCSACGEISHLSVGDVKKWYEEYHPNLVEGSLVPDLCFYCWQELSISDGVVIRKLFREMPNVRPGDSGIIQDILASGERRLFLVKLDSGKELYFIRAELRKMREGEVKPTCIVK